jgi:hypothetical protein
VTHVRLTADEGCPGFAATVKWNLVEFLTPAMFSVSVTPKVSLVARLVKAIETVSGGWVFM